MPRHGQPPGSAASAGSSTLADEHVHLLWQVPARAEELLSAAAHGRWPGVELVALAGYAQAEVLRQASDEQALLFPAVPSREVAGLARDHVRLRSAADLLWRPDGDAAAKPLREGSRGTEVRDWQATPSKLSATGMPSRPKIAMDGTFGPKAKTATHIFQRSVHVAADGIASWTCRYFNATPVPARSPRRVARQLPSRPLPL
jgi:hypothetical protein